MIFHTTRETAFINASIRNIDDQPNSSSGDQGTELTHQTHVMSLRRTKEDPIFRMGRDLLKDDCSSLRILHERRLGVALLMKDLGIPSSILGDSQPSFERPRVLSESLFREICKFCDRVGSRGCLKLRGRGSFNNVCRCQIRVPVGPGGARLESGGAKLARLGENVCAVG